MKYFLIFLLLLLLCFHDVELSKNKGKKKKQKHWNYHYYNYIVQLERQIVDILVQPVSEEATEIVDYVEDYAFMLEELLNRSKTFINESFVYEKANKDGKDTFDSANEVLEFGGPKFFDVDCEKEEMMKSFNWDEKQYQSLIDKMENVKKAWTKFIEEYTEIRSKIKHPHTTTPSY